MRTLGFQTLLDLVQVTLLAGLTLSLGVSRTAAQECEALIGSAVGPITNFVSHEDYLYELVPYIQDPTGQGAVQNFCEVFPRVRTKLTNLLQECRGSGDIKVYLAKMAGFDYMCNAGQVDYGRHGKCIYEMASKLKEDCPIEHSSLNSIRKASVFATADTMASICTEIQKYIQCSRELISKGCEGADAGNWYVSFLKSVLKYMTDNKQLKCSFGAPTGVMNNSVTTIAIFVGVGVLVLLLLFCFCWCCRAGVCSCCKEDDEEDVKYHMPDSNDNEKDLSGVNSVV